MPNWFTRAVERVTNTVGGLFGREQPDITRTPTAPLPREGGRTLGERLRDAFQPGRVERERLERELAETRERAELAERQAQSERQAREQAERQAQAERQERERIERERPAPAPKPPAQADPVKETIERDKAEAQRQRQEPERTDKMRKVTPGADPLAGIPSEISFGPKGQAGAIYSRHSPDQAMSDLHRAADAGQRVTIRVHDANGWHEVFINVGRQAGKGINARHLIDDRIAGRELADYIRGFTTGTTGTSNGTGGTPGYTFSMELDAYQVVVYS